MKEIHFYQDCAPQIQPGETSRCMLCVDFFFFSVLYYQVSSLLVDIICTSKLPTPGSLNDRTVSPDNQSVWNHIFILKEGLHIKSLAAILTLLCTEQCWRKLVKIMNPQVSISVELYSGNLNSRQIFILSDFPGDSNVCSP